MDLGRLFQRARQNKDVTAFNAIERNNLIEKFLSQKGQDFTENKPAADDNLGGVKVFQERMKNAESAAGFHMLSNLTIEQVAEGTGYDGKTKVGDLMKTSSLETIPVSERRKHRLGQQEFNK